MSLIRIVLWILLGWFLLWAGKWGYFIYKAHESFLPDVNIPLKLQKGYKYVFEYIPPDASLKEQTWSLEIEGISFNKEYESHLKNLMLNDGIEHISKIKEGYLYPAPVIKTRVKNLETDEVYENVLSFQNKNSSHVCNETLQNIWCYHYRADVITGQRWLRFFPNKKYLIEIEVLHSDIKQVDLKSKLILGNAHFKKAYRF
ncbi:hypothetical protein JFL47_10865 [Haemophilus haemoglobinophilus]|nr:hypothetical protein [Canicola haemoglobinophilus]MBN6711719.1 hypothetical protein [Canicola haemoglobinophilus]